MYAIYATRAIKIFHTKKCSLTKIDTITETNNTYLLQFNNKRQ